MKKIFTLLAAAALTLSAQAQEGVTYQVKTLTFEDSDYPQDAPNYLGKTTWSSLIDTPQYGGELLYGENHGDTAHASTNVNYCWYDKGNTNLYSELPVNWGTKMYWGGGHAISNYWDGNLNDGDYTHQLAVYVADESGNGQGGHGNNGSDNFCVHYGYKDNSGYSASNLPCWQFKDGLNHVIEEMYIANTTYFVNAITNGNGLTDALGDDDYVKIQVTGYKLDGTVTKTLNFELAKGSSFKKKWTCWDLSRLGEVNRVEFNVIGTSDNGYGFSQPAYFCYDDVKVRMPINEESNSPYTTVASLASDPSSEKELRAYNDNLDYGTSLQKDVPEGVTFSFDGDLCFSAGETETYTIKNLPNVRIKKIKTTFYIEDDFDNIDMELDAYLGGQHIASLNIAGFKSPYLKELSDVQDIDQNSPSYMMNMLDASQNANSGDLVFKLSSKSGSFDAPALCEKYIITYEIVDPTGISEFKTVVNTNAEEVARFSADGKRITAPQSGINIVRMSDGTVRRVLVK